MPGLYILDTDMSGRGVFTSREINERDLIEVCQVVVIPKSELPIVHKTILHDYYFLWGPDMKDGAIALGYGSLYNHAIHPNADFILDIENMSIDIVAIKDIQPGEEITINYHGEPGNDKNLWF